MTATLDSHRSPRSATSGRRRGALSFAGTAGAAPRDGRCVAANLSVLDGPTKAAVANGSVDLGVSLSEAIQVFPDSSMRLSAA